MSAPVASRRARFVRGLLEGAAIAGLAWLALRLFNPNTTLAPEIAGAAAALLAVLCGLSRAVTGGLLGGLAGVAAGVLVMHWVVGKPPPNFLAPGKFVGQRAHIKGPTVSEGSFDIAQYKGKVVVVDFWATWCVPCLRLMPEMIELYEKYHAEGLEVVGVSSDTNEDDLARFVKQRKIPWPHIIYPPDANTSRRPNPNSDAYDVKGIPHTLVVDREGIIVAQGVHGDQLRQAVEKALRGPEAAPDDRGQMAMLVLFVILGWLAGTALEWSFRQPAERPAAAR